MSIKRQRYKLSYLVEIMKESLYMASFCTLWQPASRQQLQSKSEQGRPAAGMAFCPSGEEKGVVWSQQFPTSWGSFGVRWELGRMHSKGSLERSSSSPEKYLLCLSWEFFCWERELSCYHINQRRGGCDSWFRTTECGAWKKWKLGLSCLKRITSTRSAFLVSRPWSI